MRPAPWPRAGDVVWIGPEASVHFAAPGFPFRVTRVDERSTYQGWVWLFGYVLSPAGDAVIRRELFVRQAGLRPLRYDGRHVGPGFNEPQ